MKHHYIPKLILKNFTKNGMIYIYRHDSKRIFCTSINDSFAKNNLNTIIDDNGLENKNIIEEIFDKYFESKASLSIQLIVKDLKSTSPSGEIFSVEDYLNLLRFCMLCNYRSPFALNNIHHAMRVSAYGAVYLKYYLDFGTLDFPYDLDFPKKLPYSYLRDFDKGTEMLLDLKLTLFYHKVPDVYFIIPDQYVVITSPNHCKFADKDLKIYFPISSNVVVCFERVNRKFYKGMSKLDRKGVEQFNRFFLKNTYESFGCQSYEYLKEITSKFNKDILPLKKFKIDNNFAKEKLQIKNEIIAKIILNINRDNYDDGIITSVNYKHEYKILTKDQFEKEKKKLNSIFEIKEKVIKTRK